MSSQSPSISDLDEQSTTDSGDTEEYVPMNPPVNNGTFIKRLPPFWHDCLVETAMILSMALYYVVGNENLRSSYLSHINPLFSIPFLFVFAALCWYRLSCAIALLPLALPYYLQHKIVFSHYGFSLTEITLGTCAVVAVLQFLLKRSLWQYRLSWRKLVDRLGPFSIPMLIFFIAAAISIFIAYDKALAQRSFREEVFDPLLYILLALYCLRTRQDVRRLLAALIGTGFIIAVLGMIQYFFFKNTLILESDGIRRVHVMYGSANSIGLLFDYVLPIAFALLVAETHAVLVNLASWTRWLLAFVLCVPMFYVLYLTQSQGAWLAITVAILFIATASIRSRKVLLVGIPLFLLAVAIAFFFFHSRINNFIFDNHVDIHHVSTTTKRLYLWESALNMIHDSPWFGYGLDNWLCHYSYNFVCFTPQLHHYLIAKDPVTGISTDLKYEPLLSHPHNVFLHVWVSMGIFGLLAFVTILLLFSWLFVRILRNLRAHETQRNSSYQWMTIGVGAAMLAAMTQGIVDSAFLEQDLAFCFWMLVTALLLLRVLTKTPWRGRISATASNTTSKV